MEYNERLNRYLRESWERMERGEVSSDLDKGRGEFDKYFRNMVRRAGVARSLGVIMFG
jgi:hypothetical protein